MIAPAKPVSSRRSRRVSQKKFEEMLPLIQKQAAYAFRDSKSEQKEELVAETVANAYCAFVRLVRRGYESIVYPTPLATFAIKQVRSGRRVGGKPRPRDVMSQLTRKEDAPALGRLNRHSAGDDGWLELLVEDRNAGPCEIAITRIDFEDWLQLLSRRHRRIATALAGGETTTCAAKEFGVTPARISQLRREFHDSWREFQGECTFPVGI